MRDYGSSNIIEFGPGRHGATEGFFVYIREPGGNRIKIFTGDTETLEPDWEPIRWLASANRDESVWKNPDEFMLDRPNINRHLAFGYGIHFCLGAELARLEARVVLTMLLDRFPHLSLDPAFDFQLAGGAMLRGPKHLHVVW